MQLNTAEARILGSLIEKQCATPQQYPLTANALLLACNQASGREPVTSFDEDEIQAGLESLRARSLVRFVLPSHGRSVVRYKHVLDERLPTSALALIALLLLRGAQTAGELRTRSERLFEFPSIADVEAALTDLSSSEEPFVLQLERRPGQKEERWTELLAAHVEEAAPVVTTTPLASLRAEVSSLAEDLARMRVEFDALRSSLGG